MARLSSLRVSFQNYRPAPYRHGFELVVPAHDDTIEILIDDPRFPTSLQQKSERDGTLYRRGAFVLWEPSEGAAMTYAFVHFAKRIDASAVVHPRDDSEEALATAAIAHEVRQPLAAMVISANAGLRWLTRAEPNLDEVQAALERIVRDGHRANEVIANVRAIFGKDRHEKARVNVNTLIGEVLGLIQEELESRRISVRSELTDGLPEVMAERVQLQQALLNLVMNAVDAMSAVTGRERRLTVRSKLDVHGVRIAVEDSGTGIDRGYVDRIFDSFFTTKPHGMGMGLSICRSIIESHGGRLWFSSRSSHGTTFYVQLPAEVENRSQTFGEEHLAGGKNEQKHNLRFCFSY
jgi:signal transduction histidine kinase